MYFPILQATATVKFKFVLSGYSKYDQKLVFKTDYHLMLVKSTIAFCNTFDLH